MLLEKDLTHGKPLFDMTNAKFAVVCDGIALPERDLDCAYLLPVFVIPSSTGEPVTCGDFRNDSPYPLLQARRLCQCRPLALASLSSALLRVPCALPPLGRGFCMIARVVVHQL